MGQTGTSLAPRSSSNGGTNNLPPILFHQVHGDNIRINGDGAVARRVESFCKAITFSSRPIKVQEKVCVKFLEVSNNWSGVIRFGFTNNDPSTLRYSLPKYACPDLTNKPGFWAKAFSERFAERGTVLFYYVTQAGDVHFGINGEEKGVFFAGVETRGPLWALFDVYGNSTAIKLVDMRMNLNNSRRNLSEDSPVDVDTHILPALQTLCIQQQPIEVEQAAVVSKYQQPGSCLVPLPFHRTRGHNVRLSNDRFVATRNETEFCHGYVFTARPIHLGEKIVIQVLTTESVYVGALAFGLTSCDPATLQSSDLPEDSDMLLDRPEYWVVNKDVASNPQRGDELAFSVAHNGEVHMSKNGSQPVVIMHVDQTLQLWAFFDVYGRTQKIKMIGAVQSSTSPTSRHNASNRIRLEQQAAPVPVVNGQRYCCNSVNTTASAAPSPATELVQLQPTLGGGTVLVVNLPPAHSNYLNQQQSLQQQQSHSPPPPPHHHHHQQQQVHHYTSTNVAQQQQHHVTPTTQQVAPAHCSQQQASGTLLSSYSNTYIEPISPGSYSTIDSWVENGLHAVGSECSICYERSIDSVLYMCGHMCMCYECAVQQWKGKGGGHCPLCRAIIRDVIRTYKS